MCHNVGDSDWIVNLQCQACHTSLSHHVKGDGINLPECYVGYEICTSCGFNNVINVNWPDPPDANEFPHMGS